MSITEYCNYDRAFSLRAGTRQLLTVLIWWNGWLAECVSAERFAGILVLKLFLFCSLSLSLAFSLSLSLSLCLPPSLCFLCLLAKSCQAFSQLGSLCNLWVCLVDGAMVGPLGLESPLTVCSESRASESRADPSYTRGISAIKKCR